MLPTNHNQSKRVERVKRLGVGGCIPEMAPAGQLGQHLDAQHRLVAARSADDANHRRQLAQIDGGRDGRTVASGRLAHDALVHGHQGIGTDPSRRRRRRRGIRGCNHDDIMMPVLAGCRVYANNAAGDLVGALAHTCDAVQQRLLVLLRTENVEHGRPEVAIHFVRHALAIHLFARSPGCGGLVRSDCRSTGAPLVLTATSKLLWS